MRSLAANNVRDFHARLFSGEESNKLFTALRQLTRVTDPKLFEEEDQPFEGWPAWYDSAALVMDGAV